MKRLNTTAIIVEGKNNTFVGVSRKDNHNSWGFGGGKCEEGENPYDCAIRELKEETGLDALELELVDIVEYTNNYSNPPTLDTVYCYRCTEYTGDLMSDEEALSKGEGLVKWVTPEELCAGAFGDYNKIRLKKLYNYELAV